MLVDYLVTSIVLAQISTLCISLGIGFVSFGCWIDNRNKLLLNIAIISFFIFFIVLIFVPYGNNLREILTEVLK